MAYFNRYIQITISEYGPERFERSDFFIAVEAYLSDSCGLVARKFKADLGRDRKKPQTSVDDGQEIVDTFNHAMFWWYDYTEYPWGNIFSWSLGDEKRRFYRVTFHRNFHAFVLDSYLPHRRLFTNNPSNRWGSGEKTFWSHVAFQHLATFDTLAIDPTEKKTIIDDLIAFKDGKDYYTKVGKAWKRGYLLFGPPGTGKSTMIAAMANFLEYDVYDLELTAVKNNTELRKLFVETTGKSIIVIEDIDCSVDLTGKRRDKKPRKKSSGENDNMTLQPMEAEKDDEDTKLTLSGVLNFIDGLWSACGGERIIIFTTNNKDALDPALIRRGRMDKHIEMSYCCCEAFKLLASNYLDITENQLFELFGEIQQLLEEVNMCPADVAEHLMRTENRDADACLQGLVVALRDARDMAIKEKEKAKEDVEKSMGKEEIAGTK
ncbi:hypothetical protein HU200_034620 [Digitaria exilis]|uniref:AAA+ ATPase domain-containing protein n=1 Tax=Digitaria exilis TaxID=1010633 RepID=A0A835BKP5_9POAL|nr:hypothetical protein HU200_034620 [Digitaria exilis]